MNKPKFPFNPEQMQQYQRDGYLIVRNFCSRKEVDRLYSVALEDDAMRTNAMDLNDQSGKKTRLSLWFTPGKDPFGYLVRTEKMVHRVHQLMGGDSPVCHFHSKLMQKEPKVGGAWEWHQDYGYWYKNQFIFPDRMMSVMIALTEANRQNGCLQVIKGSHRMGRLNHGFAGEQVGADMVMVENALKTMELVYCELNPGDALFFHSNILHRSEANLSDHPRWSLIACYNTLDNLAYSEKSPAWKVPLETVPDQAVTEWEVESLSKADFLTKDRDPALKGTGWESDVKVK
ncbi:phytanoyl-CoA dioxygenase family protein [Lunatimonas salinarum]|uniref:phytanoyl-CoA dioxygenase family protein n=1 Tax=Lunatimonas salinarum TaxID=1774590 RepID=UPI001AE0671F|nr:phytanoyl-CoA dioxygenase family protein [Lunatimonas salinarum]